MQIDRQQRGNQAEQQAQRYLQQQGLTSVTANYRCRGGEIDLIMQDRTTLVFIEVRLRTHPGFGGALASIDYKKQQRLQLAAQHYLQKNKWTGPCRFDVIGMDGKNHIDWIKDAF